MPHGDIQYGQMKLAKNAAFGLYQKRHQKSYLPNGEWKEPKFDKKSKISAAHAHKPNVSQNDYNVQREREKQTIIPSGMSNEAPHWTKLFVVPQ